VVEALACKAGLSGFESHRYLHFPLRLRLAMLWANARLIGLAACREPVQQRREHISVEMICELADSAEALAKALRQGSSPSPTLYTVLT
jgi:hypothetical protein